MDPISQRNGSFSSSHDVWKFISELGISKVLHFGITVMYRYMYLPRPKPQQFVLLGTSVKVEICTNGWMANLLRS